MPLRTKLLILVFLPMLTLNAHQHWLYVESANPSVGDSIHVHFRTGHNLEHENLLISERLIREAYIISPSEQSVPLTFQVKSGVHIASFQATETGIYTAYVNLRKRSSGPFAYLLKTRVKVGAGDTSIDFPHNQELEIVMNESEHSFEVFSQNDAVKTSVFLLTKGNPPASLIMDRNGISKVSKAETGFYVAVSHFRRQTTSYSFYLGH